MSVLCDLEHCKVCPLAPWTQRYPRFAGQVASTAARRELETVRTTLKASLVLGLARALQVSRSS